MFHLLSSNWCDILLLNWCIWVRDIVHFAFIGLCLEVVSVWEIIIIISSLINRRWLIVDFFDNFRLVFANNHLIHWHALRVVVILPVVDESLSPLLL